MRLLLACVFGLAAALIVAVMVIWFTDSIVLAMIAIAIVALMSGMAAAKDGLL